MKETRFKQTDAGPIPEDWTEAIIGNVLTIGNGKDYKHLNSGCVPVYGTGGIMNYVDEYLYDGPTVCIGRKGTIDQPQYHEGKIWTVDTLFYTHSFKNILPKYTFYLFNTIPWRQYNEATGVPSLSKSNIELISIALPQKEEQQNIISALDDIDKLILSLEKLIEKKRMMKEGTMQQLLTGKTRLLGFNNPWTNQSVEELFDFIKNNTLSRDKLGEGGIVYDVHYGDILVKYGEILNFDKESIPRIINSKASNKALRNGDIIIADTAEDEIVGKTTEVYNLGKNLAEAGLHTFALRPKIRFAPGFLGYYFNSSQIHTQILSHIQGTKVCSITKKAINTIQLSYPSDLDEQQAIVQILMDMDAEIEGFEKKLNKYKDIKSGMMQQLLTGKIRLL